MQIVTAVSLASRRSRPVRMFSARAIWFRFRPILSSSRRFSARMRAANSMRPGSRPDRTRPRDAAERAPLDRPLAEQPEPPLHLVQPGRVGGCEVQVEAWPRRQDQGVGQGGRPGNSVELILLLVGEREWYQWASEWHGSLPCLKPAAYDAHFRDCTLADRRQNPTGSPIGFRAGLGTPVDSRKHGTKRFSGAKLRSATVERLRSAVRSAS